jgi:hypothetical protein
LKEQARTLRRSIRFQTAHTSLFYHSTVSFFFQAFLYKCTVLFAFSRSRQGAAGWKRLDIRFLLPSAALRQ